MGARIPTRAVVFVSSSEGARHFSRELRRQRGASGSCRISIMYGSDGWVTYARGMAKLSERPFFDLRRAA